MQWLWNYLHNCNAGQKKNHAGLNGIRTRNLRVTGNRGTRNLRVTGNRGNRSLRVTGAMLYQLSYESSRVRSWPASATGLLLHLCVVQVRGRSELKSKLNKPIYYFGKLVHG